MKLKFLLTVVTIVVLILLGIVLYRALAPAEPLDYTVGPLTLRDISNTEQLKVFTARKEVLVSQHRINSGLIMDSEDKIYVIYPATLQLGFDLSKCDSTNVAVSGDSVTVKLPPVSILNRDGHAVDEASKRTAIESGQWSAQEMTDLRQRAEALMVRNCEYDSCYARAEQLGRQMVQSMLQSMGYSYVDVDIARRSDYGLCLVDRRFRNQHPYRWYTKDKMSYLAFNIDQPKREARLFFTPGNITERELLALGDYFSIIFAQTPRDVGIVKRGDTVYVMFHNDYLTAGTKEADKYKAVALRKDMSKLRKVVARLIFKGKKVAVMEVDKGGHLICQYPDGK